MPEIRKIICADAWWETSTTDASEVAAKYDVDVTVTVDGSSVRFHLTPLETLKMLLDFWTFCKLVVYKHAGLTTTDSSECANNFYNWNKRNEANLKRICLAYASNYNPIENYNGIITITDIVDEDDPYTKTKTISGKVKTGQEVEQISRAGTPVAGDDTSFTDAEGKTYQTTYDSTTDPSGAKLRDRTTSTPTGAYGKTTADATKNYSEWDQYTETETEVGGRTHTEEKHGNLGVTTSQSMVEDELKLRRHDILREYLQMYVDENLFMGDDDCDSRLLYDF